MSQGPPAHSPINTMEPARLSQRQPAQQRRGDRAEAEGQRPGAQRDLAPAERDVQSALQPQPAERRRLLQPQRTRQIGEAAAADVEGDHLLVEPERPAHHPEGEPEGQARERDRQRRVHPARPASPVAHTSPGVAPMVRRRHGPRQDGAGEGSDRLRLPAPRREPERAEAQDETAGERHRDGPHRRQRGDDQQRLARPRARALAYHDARATSATQPPCAAVRTTCRPERSQATRTSVTRVSAMPDRIRVP